LDFSLTYALASNDGSDGVVPTITFGNVYAVAREGCVTSCWHPRPPILTSCFVSAPVGMGCDMIAAAHFWPCKGTPSVKNAAVSRRAFSGDQYGPEMSPADVKKYFSESPQGAQVLLESQRDLARRFGAQGVRFQDWLAVKVGCRETASAMSGVCF
jgi:hypothetical protein